LDRFDTGCGGSNHGNVSNLSTADRENVSTYLESL
jgi:hypothetical protein